MSPGPGFRICAALALVAATSGCFRSGGGTGRGATVGVQVGDGSGSIRVGPGAARGAFDRSTPPAVGDPAPVRLARLFDFVLPEGPRVVVAERRALPLVQLELRFRGGATAEGTGEAGLAGLALNLLEEGTATRTASEIAGALDLLGAELSLREGYDEVALSLTVLEPNFREALEVVADLVRTPTFPEAGFERVRRERTHRLLQRADDPAALASDRLAEALFGAEHPYGASLFGTQATLDGFTRDDVVRYHERVLHAGNASFTVVGDVTRDGVEALLAELFAGWAGGEAAPEPPAPPTRPGAGSVHIVDRPGAPQSEIRVGMIGVARDDPAHFDLLVLNTLLGGAFTSRLNANLREDKGWTYGAGSAFRMRRAPGSFLVATAVHTPVTIEAVREILMELERIAAEPVPQEEVARAAAYLALRLPERFETRAGLAGELAELALHDLPLDFFDGFVASVREVNAERVQAAARRVLSGPWTIVVVGDRAALEEPLRALGVGEVAVHPSPLR